MSIQTPHINSTILPSSFSLLPVINISLNIQKTAVLPYYNPSSYSYPVDCMIEIWKKEKYEPSVTWLGKCFDIITGWTLNEQGIPNPSLIDRIKRTVDIWFSSSDVKDKEIEIKNEHDQETEDYVNSSLIDRIKNSVKFWLGFPNEGGQRARNEILKCLIERSEQLLEEVQDLEIRAHELVHALQFINTNLKDFYNADAENLDPLLSRHETLILDLINAKTNFFTKYDIKQIIDFFLSDRLELSSIQDDIKWRLFLYYIKNAYQIESLLKDIEPVITDFSEHLKKNIDGLILKEVLFINKMIFEKNCGYFEHEEYFKQLKFLNSISHPELNSFISELRWKEKKELLLNLFKQKENIEEKIAKAMDKSQT